MAYDFSELNVLVVDDSIHMQQILRSILASMRIEKVRAVSTPAEAFSVIQSWVPDIILTELALGNTDGLDFVRRIRDGADGTNPFVPIFLLTGSTEVARVKEARDAGVTDVLAKPVSIKALYDRFVAAVQDPRPYVKTKTYMGPDRRRKDRPFKGDGKRRTDGSVSKAS